MIIDIVWIILLLIFLWYILTLKKKENFANELRAQLANRQILAAPWTKQEKSEINKNLPQNWYTMDHFRNSINYDDYFDDKLKFLFENRFSTNSYDNLNDFANRYAIDIDKNYFIQCIWNCLTNNPTFKDFHECIEFCLNDF